MTALRREVRHEKSSPGWGERWLLHGDLGSVQFLMSARRAWDVPDRSAFAVRMDISGYDLGYHWREPRYEHQGSWSCEWTPEGRCFYDGSSLEGERVLGLLIAEGPEAVWAELDSYYRSLSEGDAIGGFGAVLDAIAQAVETPGDAS